MRINPVVVMMGVALAGLDRTASASGPQLVVEEPATNRLDFARVPFDGQSAPQRIRIRNDGDPVQHQEISPSGPFMIVATGGGFATGEEQFWDVVCAPVDPDPNSGALEVDVCGTSCSDNEWIEFIDLDCQAGLLDTPSTFVGIAANAYETGREILPFTNPGPDPLTITGFAGHDPAISGALANGSLPVTLAAGESVDVVAMFDATGSDVTAYLDVVAGTTIAARVLVEGLTLSQLNPAALSLGLVPQGAVYTIPITVRNSFPSARMITAITSDLADYTVSGLAGVTLAPGELARGIVTLTAGTLGARTGNLSVVFERGQGSTGRLFATVVPPTFSLTTADGTPNDGRLDFGTRKAGSGPVEQNFKITNLTTVAQSVVICDSSTAPFELVGDCPTTLPAGGSVELTMRFTPAMVGDFLDGAGLGLNAFGHVDSLISARVVASQLAFSVAELAFPDTLRAAAAQRSVTITNLAANPITVPIAVTGAGFTSGASDVTIAGGATADIVVEFHPASAGAFTGTLELGVAGDLDHTTVALSGLGLSPMVSVAPALDLGSVTVGATGEAMLAIHNLDPVNSFTIDQLVIDGDGFAVVPAANPVLAPGATIEIAVRFAPTIAGPATGTLAVVLAGDPIPHAIVNLTAVGEAAPPDAPPHHTGGCSTSGSGSVGGLAIAMLALVRPRRRSPTRE